MPQQAALCQAHRLWLGGLLATSAGQVKHQDMTAPRPTCRICLARRTSERMPSAWTALPMPTPEQQASETSGSFLYRTQQLIPILLLLIIET